MNSEQNIVHIIQNYYYTIHRVKNRVVFEPCDELRVAQKYFLNAIKWKYPLKSNVKECAKIHVGRKWILKMDIKDFYSSVPTKDISKIVSKICSKTKSLNSFYDFNLVTVDGKLPVGALTSSHIANACFISVEKDIRNFCNILDVNFSRYIDDLTFSCDEKEILKLVEKKVTLILNFYGYTINKKKTKYISDNKQQNVLGLVVNGRNVRLTKKYKKLIRAKIHNYVVSLAKSENKIADLNYPVRNEKEYNSLLGSISYIEHIDLKYYLKLRTYFQKLAKAQYLDLNSNNNLNL